MPFLFSTVQHITLLYFPKFQARGYVLWIKSMTSFNFTLLAKLVLVLAIACVNAGLLPSLGIKRRSSSATAGDENEEDIKENHRHRGRRKLLPKVVPHPDNWYVLHQPF